MTNYLPTYKITYDMFLFSNLKSSIDHYYFMVINNLVHNNNSKLLIDYLKK